MSNKRSRVEEEEYHPPPYYPGAAMGQYSASRRREQLLLSSISFNTAERYAAGVKQAVQFLIGYNDWNRNEVVRLEPSRVDEQVMDMITDCQRRDGSLGARQHCVDMVAGLQKFIPVLKGSLRLSQSALDGWAAVEPSVITIPLLSNIVDIIAYRQRIRASDAARGLKYAILTALGRECYLRVHSEAFGITKRDIHFYAKTRRPTDSTGCTIYARIRLAKCKTGQDQSVTLRDETLADALVDIVTDLDEM